MLFHPRTNRLRRALLLLSLVGVGASLVLCVWPGSLLAQETQKPDTQTPTAESDAKDAKESTGTEKKLPRSARWPVSWGVDPYTTKMRVKPVRTTIAHLVSFKRPAYLPGKGTIPVKYRTQRIAPVETTVWSIKGTAVSCAAEHDGDYRLLVADAKGRQVTCVMPDPMLAPKRGRFSAQIDVARAAVVRKFHPTFTPQKVRVPVQIVGIGYFGRLNSDANPSPEGFQLHPVLSVRFPSE